MPAVTIIIDDAVLKKLREIQAKEIRKTARNVSFSRIANETIKKGLAN